MSSKNNFYVYALLDTRKPGNFKYGNWKFAYEPFYIGKGKGKRAAFHLLACGVKQSTSRTRSPIKVNKILSIRKSGKEPDIRYIMENMQESDAFALEIKLIGLIGKKVDKKGPLTNITDGGEGTSGYVGDELHCTRKSIAAKRWYASLSDEEKANLFAKRAKATRIGVSGLSSEVKASQARAISDTAKRRTAEERAALSEKFSHIQKNLPEDVDSARRRKLSVATKANIANMTEKELEQRSIKLSKGIKNAWGATPTDRRYERVAHAAHGRHYGKTETELADINSKISDTMANMHASMTMMEKRVRSYRVMCGVMISNAGKKGDAELKKRVADAGDAFYAKAKNLKVDPKQLRERVRRFIDAWVGTDLCVASGTA